MARFVAEDAERCRADCEMLFFDKPQCDPSRGQGAPELAVRKKCDVPVQRAQIRDEPVHTIGNVCEHFTAGVTIRPYVPVEAAAPAYADALSPSGADLRSISNVFFGIGRGKICYVSLNHSHASAASE